MARLAIGEENGFKILMTTYLSSVSNALGLNTNIFGSPTYLWIATLGLSLVFYLFIRRILAIIAKVITKNGQNGNQDSSLSKQTVLFAGRLVAKTNRVLIGFFAFLFALRIFDIKLPFIGLLTLVFQILIILQFASWASQLLSAVVSSRLTLSTSTSHRSAYTVIVIIGKSAIWSAAALLILENVGINISTLVTGLGIGGIAVALAVQRILGDLIGSLSIILDRPFEVGDAILVGDFQGTVEQIGITTTRLRGLGGEQLIIANSDLLASRIRNFKRMSERRVIFTLSVGYQTSLEKLKRIPEIIQTAIERHSEARFERAHFFRYGQSSLDFEVVYFITSPDYKLYMDIQQAVYLEIFSEFAIHSITFSQGVQTVMLGKESQSTAI